MQISLSLRNNFKRIEVIPGRKSRKSLKVPLLVQDNTRRNFLEASSEIMGEF